MPSPAIESRVNDQGRRVFAGRGQPCHCLTPHQGDIRRVDEKSPAVLRQRLNAGFYRGKHALGIIRILHPDNIGRRHRAADFGATMPHHHQYLFDPGFPKQVNHPLDASPVTQRQQRLEAPHTLGKPTGQHNSRNVRKHSHPNSI